jgi:hypothetical protein
MPRYSGYPHSHYTQEELGRACIYHIFRKDGEPQDEYVGQAVHLGNRWYKHLRELRLGENTPHLHTMCPTTLPRAGYTVGRGGVSQ